MRRELTDIATRVRRLQARARLLFVPPLLLIDVTDWPDEARSAYAGGSEDERSALEIEFAGPLPTYSGDDDLAVVALIVSEVPTGLDEDDGDRPTLDPALDLDRRKQLLAITSRAAGETATDRPAREHAERERYLRTKGGRT